MKRMKLVWHSRARGVELMLLLMLLLLFDGSVVVGVVDGRVVVWKWARNILNGRVGMLIVEMIAAGEVH